jgi:dTMP kinase
MNPGVFITFEGTEGSGKSTQISLLAGRLQSLGHPIKLLREPGGTPIGEELRHILKHSAKSQAMTAEAELLLMSASRAQLVREVIQPALKSGITVLCDRFFDSTTVYQGYGRGLDLEMIHQITQFAVGSTQPDLTLLFMVPIAVSEQRRQTRQNGLPPERDRFEEAGREFFAKVEYGYNAIARQEPGRIKLIDATQTIEQVQTQVSGCVDSLLQNHRTA